MESTNLQLDSLHTYTFDTIVKKYNVTSIIFSIFLIVIGISCFILAYNSSNVNSSLNMLFMTVGTIAILIGLFRAFWRSSENVYLPTGSATKEGVCYFEPDDLKDLNVELRNKQFEGNEKRHIVKRTGKVRLDYIITGDKKFVAAQLYNFVPYNYEVASQIFFFNDKEAESFAHCLERRKF